MVGHSIRPPVSLDRLTQLYSGGVLVFAVGRYGGRTGCDGTPRANWILELHAGRRQRVGGPIEPIAHLFDQRIAGPVWENAGGANIPGCQDDPLRYRLG